MADRYNVQSPLLLCPVCKMKVKALGTASHFRNVHSNLEYEEYKNLFKLVDSADAPRHVEEMKSQSEVEPIYQPHEEKEDDGLTMKVREYDYLRCRCPWCGRLMTKGRGCFNRWSYDDNARGVYVCNSCDGLVFFY